MEEIISAIATANGVGGVAIIRVSGNGALELASKMFKPLSKNIQVNNFEPYKMYVGEIDGGTFTDFGMAVYFKAPKSYTGEDMVEFHCHGGLAISRGILKRTFELGAVPATRGEFTKRAFINGKLSLDGAEGLISMINGESIASVKAGYNLYREKLNAKILELQNDLTYSLASIDADIDYPEEDLQATAISDVESALNKTLTTVNDLIKKYDGGAKIKNGVKVAIVGKPNTGKSSILNMLLNYDKAIVSSIAGTTRDVVEGSLEINGINFYFYDTAGIREASDEIEKIGIEKSSKILKSADIALVVFDGSNMESEDEAILNEVTSAEIIKVYNKLDISNKEYKNALNISAKTGEGLEELKQKLFDSAFKEGIDLNGEFITEERHFNALNKAKRYIEEALSNLNLVPLDLVAEDVKMVWDSLGEITGKTASEEIIDEIFKKFCVGK
ncbi:MAG: tRNA uridine-5-carboxymethylaminomethyl(34) synthesis GTPase MnmE [Clostridia bacterium]|nr:tRNA uridine-5-carboxymethylaminomethyl(34) synthesis GTPase MnmE [Clostridia bacterium]